MDEKKLIPNRIPNVPMDPAYVEELQDQLHELRTILGLEENSAHQMAAQLAGLCRDKDREIEELEKGKAEQYQLAQYYRSVLQEIRDKTPAYMDKVWPHHHWYLYTATDAINHEQLEVKK